MCLTVITYFPNNLTTRSITLEDLFDLESDINVELDLFGSTYLERLYNEYLCWIQVGLDLDSSPLEVPLKLFNLALEAAGKIGTAVLREFGAGREWNLSKRIIRRIKGVLSCLEEMKIIVMQANAGVGLQGYEDYVSTSTRLQGKADPRGLESLKAKHVHKELLFQQEDEKRWLDRYSCNLTDPWP